MSPLNLLNFSVGRSELSAIPDTRNAVTNLVALI